MNHCKNFQSEEYLLTQSILLLAVCKYFLFQFHVSAQVFFHVTTEVLNSHLMCRMKVSMSVV